MTTMRSALALLLALASSGCGVGPASRARARLAAGDLGGAVEAAGTSPAALREVAIAVLAAGLRDDEARAAAFRGLVVAGGRARPQLERLLDETDPALSCAALSLLARRELEGVRPRLVACLEESDPAARAVAVGASPLRNAEEVASLGVHLGDPEAEVRLAAIEALGATRVARAEAGLLLAAVARDDPDRQVRSRALAALPGLVAPEVVVEVASGQLGDEALPVRLAAVEALGAVDADRARVELRALLERGAGPEAVRAAASLGRGSDEGAIGLLARLLAEGSAADATAAAVAAGQLGASLAEALLAALGRPEPQVRLAVAVALRSAGRLGESAAELARLLEEPGLFGLLAAAAGDDSPRVRERFAEALSDADPAVRAYAAMSCASKTFGLEVVRPALADPAPTVRVAAATTVLRLLRRVG